jgi:methylated-DNA-[protein]-cysteine S-methyltransferase
MFRTPLDLRSLTPFQQSVLQETRKIPYGSVITYGDIAGKIGNPGAFRAVGTALGCNPIPILIPCHRVVASGGKIGGFTGGLALKEKLLLIEGFDPETLKHPKDRTR